jgi:hypothetical protein
VSSRGASNSTMRLNVRAAARRVNQMVEYFALASN